MCKLISGFFTFSVVFISVFEAIPHRYILQRLSHTVCGQHRSFFLGLILLFEIFATPFEYLIIILVL